MPKNAAKEAKKNLNQKREKKSALRSRSAAKAKPENKPIKTKTKTKSQSTLKAQPKTQQKDTKKTIQKTKSEAKSVKKSIEDEKNRKERLRKLLIKKREDIVREAKSEIKKLKSGERKQLIETVMDDGDLSVVDLAEDISLKQLSNHRETLIKIDAALMKIKESTYGLCEECGDEITEARLMIMPFAIYCKDCQEKQEAIAKIEKEGRV